MFLTASMIHRRIIRVDTCASQMHDVDSTILLQHRLYELRHGICFRIKISYILEKEHRKEVMNLRFRPLCPRDLYVHATINQLTTRETSKNTVEVVFWLKPKKTVCDLSRTVCAR